MCTRVCGAIGTLTICGTSNVPATFDVAVITSEVGQLSLKRTILFELHWLTNSHKEVINIVKVQPKYWSRMLPNCLVSCLNSKGKNTMIVITPFVILAGVAMLLLGTRFIKLAGLISLIGTGIATIAIAGWFPSLKEIANWLSGNIWLDGSSLFFVGTTLFLWAVRLAVVIEHGWFYTDQSYDRYHKQGCWLPIRWTSTGIGFLLICIQIAAYLTRLP